jgi:enoyl-CoA hydratase
MNYKNIIFFKEPPLAIVTINRPEALNALNSQTLTELDDCFTFIEKDSETLCVIVTGGGEKSFVAGADIKELADDNVISGRARMDKGQALFSKIENLPKPVIAAINGFALGGGCELAMACDIRLAADKAKLGQPEVNLGIIPGYGGTQRLARLVGPGVAKKLIFSGDFVKAEEALQIGLVDGVYAADKLLDEAKKLALRISSKAPLAVKAAKEAINFGLDTDLQSGLKHEASLFAGICATEDKAEGTGAFLEKREPKWKGR